MKLYTFISDNLQTLNTSWKQDLDEMGFEELKTLLYDEYEDLDANILLAYVVLCYDKDSTHVNLHKDRYEDKTRILKKVSKGHDLDEEWTTKIIQNEDPVINAVVDWYLEQQKDWRWKSIVKNFEYHSFTLKMQGDMADTKRTLEIGKVLDEGQRLRREGEKMLEEIQKDFSTLDSLLDAEKKEKITKFDFMSHEAWLRSTKNNN